MSILEGFPTPVRSLQSPEYRDPSSEIGDLAVRIDAAERLASERHQWALEAIATLADVVDLRERLVRLESVRVQSVQLEPAVRLEARQLAG
jgi:hypothetical protein